MARLLETEFALTDLSCDCLELRDAFFFLHVSPWSGDEDFRTGRDREGNGSPRGSPSRFFHTPCERMVVDPVSQERANTAWSERLT